MKSLWLIYLYISSIILLFVLQYTSRWLHPAALQLLLASNILANLNQIQVGRLWERKRLLSYRLTRQPELCWEQRWEWTDNSGKFSCVDLVCRRFRWDLHMRQLSCTCLRCTPTSRCTPLSNCRYTGTTTWKCPGTPMVWGTGWYFHHVLPM